MFHYCLHLHRLQIYMYRYIQIQMQTKSLFICRNNYEDSIHHFKLVNLTVKVPTIINVVKHSTLSWNISVSVRYLTIVLMNYLIYHCVSLQYVSEVVIGAPYAVTADLMDHFKVHLLFPFINICVYIIMYKRVHVIHSFIRQKWRDKDDKLCLSLWLYYRVLDYLHRLTW